MLWNGIEDLKLLIIDLNNSLKKRVELATKATADLLTNSVFCVSGPVKRRAGIQGGTGDSAGECLLQQSIPDGWTLSIFPNSDSEATARPLIKARHDLELHLAISLLRIIFLASPPRGGLAASTSGGRASTGPVVLGAGARPR